MSRGGRFGRGGSNMLAGATWEDDADRDKEIKEKIKPSELFPPHTDLPHPRRLTPQDRRIIKNANALRTAIHDGPLHTQSNKPSPFESKKIYGEDQSNQSFRTRAGGTKADFDPFENGAPTYMSRFNKVKKTIPQLSGRPFCKELFPPELHDTLEGTNTSTRGPRGKKLLLALTPEQQKAEELRREQLFDALEAEDGAGDEKGIDNDEDGLGDEDDHDYDFEDDEEDMGGDYNAQQYFDDGAGDEGDDDGGGEDEY